jgi:hypothetical protein
MIVATGKRVPLNTQAPLSLPGMLCRSNDPNVCHLVRAAPVQFRRIRIRLSALRTFDSSSAVPLTDANTHSGRGGHCEPGGALLLPQQPQRGSQPQRTAAACSKCRGAATTNTAGAIAEDFDLSAKPASTTSAMNAAA